MTEIIRLETNQIKGDKTYSPFLLNNSAELIRQEVQDKSSYFLTSIRLQGEALEAINDLSPVKQSKWWEHQAKIANSENPRERNTSKMERDIEFPQISGLITASSQLIELGSIQPGPFTLSRQGSLNQSPDILAENQDRPQMLSDGSIMLATNLRPTKLEIPKVELVNGQIRIDWRHVNEAIPNEMRTSTLWNRRIAERLKPDQQKSVFSLCQTPNPLIRSHNSTIPKEHWKQLFPGLASNNPPFKLEYIPRSPIVKLSDSAKLFHQSIDTPSNAQILGARADNLVRQISRNSNYEVSSHHLGQELETIFDDSRIDTTEKHGFASQMARMVSATDESITSIYTRAITAAQIAHQAANLRTVDQGPNPTCNFSTIEKVMLIKHPDIFARMLADATICSSTETNKSGYKIELDPEWLKVQKESRLHHPPKDEVRSQASTYFALISGNLRFQMFLDDAGKELKFVHKNGVDQVTDYTGDDPRPIYDHIDSGRHRYDSKPKRGPEYKIEVNKDLQVVMEKPLASPRISYQEMIDFYEELSGESGKGLMIGKTDARYLQDDDRISRFKNTDDLHRLLSQNSRSNNFPVIFAQPGHVVTINGYNPRTRLAEYDNQWGDNFDFVGEKAMPLNVLLSRTSGDDPVWLARHEDRLNRQRNNRKEYERWCKAAGVVQDSRYPTLEEVNAWRKNTSKTVDR